MKKAQGMPLSVVIIAIILLIVLVVLIIIFTGKTGQFAKTAGTCITKGGKCMSLCEDPYGKVVYAVVDADCPEGQKCCVLLYERE